LGYIGMQMEEEEEARQQVSGVGTRASAGSYVRLLLGGTRLVGEENWLWFPDSGCAKAHELVQSGGQLL